MAIEIEEIVLKARIADGPAGPDPETAASTDIGFGDMEEEEEASDVEISEALEGLRRSILDSCARMIRAALSEQKTR